MKEKLNTRRAEVEGNASMNEALDGCEMELVGRPSFLSAKARHIAGGVLYCIILNLAFTMKGEHIPHGCTSKCISIYAVYKHLLQISWWD